VPPGRKNYFESLSSITKSKLGELLLTVADQELMIERHRQSLAVLPDFEPYAAFTRVDRERKEYITARDIVTFIRGNSGKELHET
jgi:Ca2+-binding EF-hand superfamily protein